MDRQTVTGTRTRVYVLQVTTGQELVASQRICAALSALAKNPGGYDLAPSGCDPAESQALSWKDNLPGFPGTCFTPQAQVAKKFGGRWHQQTHALFPGYVFVELVGPLEQHERILRKLARQGLGRVLSIDGVYSALIEDEVAWLRRLDHTGDHVMPMSEGFIEGDQIYVTSGPLQGLETAIVKVDRHKRLAWLQVHILGRDKLVKIGLEIVAKRPSARQQIKGD